MKVNRGIGRAMVYAWIIPAKVAGGRTLTTPEGRRVALQLRQRFQRFSGRVTGDGMNGRVTGGGAWRAARVTLGALR